MSQLFLRKWLFQDVSTTLTELRVCSRQNNTCQAMIYISFLKHSIVLHPMGKWKKTTLDDRTPRDLIPKHSRSLCFMYKNPILSKRKNRFHPLPPKKKSRKNGTNFRKGLSFWNNTIPTFYVELPSLYNLYIWLFLHKFKTEVFLDKK